MKKSNERSINNCIAGIKLDGEQSEGRIVVVAESRSMVSLLGEANPPQKFEVVFVPLNNDMLTCLCKIAMDEKLTRVSL